MTTLLKYFFYAVGVAVLAVLYLTDPATVTEGYVFRLVRSEWVHKFVGLLMLFFFLGDLVLGKFASSPKANDWQHPIPDGLNWVDRTLFRVGLVKLSSFANYEETVRARNGGIAKRLDEHRELVELLEKKAPELLQEHFWVRGWLEGQDDFLGRLYAIAEARGLVPEHWGRSLRAKPSYAPQPANE